MGNIVGIQAQEIAKVAEKYATMSISEAEVNFPIFNLDMVISINDLSKSKLPNVSTTAGNK